MSDFLVGVGLVLVIEGLVWALSPRLALKVLASAAVRPESVLRLSGCAAVMCGVVLVWAVRG